MRKSSNSMRFIFIIFFGITCVDPICSQGVLNNGAQIVFSGASQMYIDGTAGHYTSQSGGLISSSSSSTISLTGDWNNNSANVGFVADGGGVVLTGAAQNISGSAATAFYNLSLAGNGIKTLAVNSTTVGGQSVYTGILSIGTSTLDLNSNRIDVTNSATGAITRSSGYIISETNSAVNPSIIRWYHRTVGGSKVYPFGVGGSYIPFTFSISTSMTNAAGYVDVSTRATATASNLPWAGASNLGGAVAHMFSPNGNFPDGSDEVVIDRWWDITNSDPVTADITFSYRGIENTLTPPYNVGFIGPQYWNGTAWISDNLIIGSGAAIVSGASIGNVSASGINTFCPWVLSSKLSPLPIELLSFNAKCVNQQAVLEWCTASEKENNYFLVEQSFDGVNFTTIGQVFGNGSTIEKHCYRYITSATSGLVYFKLTAVDNNGIKSISKIISLTSCGNPDGTIVIANDGTKEIGIIVNSLSDQNVQLYVHNSIGQLVEIIELNILKGNNALRITLNNVSNAFYYVSAYHGSEKLISKKICVNDLGY